MTDDATPSPDDEAIRDAVVQRYQAERDAALAQTAFWHGQASLWRRVAVGFALLVVSIGVTAILILNWTHHEGSITRSKADQVLDIAQRLTSPQAQKAQASTFYSAEAGIFRLDCIAKAHQLTIANNNQGGTVTEPQLEAECGRIQPPQLP